MAEEKDSLRGKRFGLRDVSGTTIAVTSLAILGAAAVLTTPLWLWYRRKRKKTDALIRQAPRAEPAAEEAGKSSSPTSE